MGRWVVFGGTGYIGASLCLQLVARGSEVISISSSDNGPDGCEHLALDLTKDTDFEQLFRPGDRVVYAAGLASRKACERNPDQAKILNCECPLAVLRAAESAGAESFTYLSSVKAMIPPPGHLACENTGQPATDSYGHSKWLAEQRLLSTRGSCRVNVIRPAAVYGELGAPRQSGSAATKLRSVLRLLGRICPLLPASGRRSTVHIKDLVSAIEGVTCESGCDRQTFIAAEPCFYDLAGIASVVSGRRVRSNRHLTSWLLSPLRPLARLASVRRFLEVERCELYSAARLRAALNWRARSRYGDYLRGEV